MAARFTLRVYIEDTDMGGIVYHSNYLKFIERARSEWVRDLGIDQMQMKQDLGVIFVVRRIEADYLRPAQYDDMLAVSTEVALLGNSRIELDQVVWRGDERLFAAKVTLVCLAARGPVRLPVQLRDAIEQQSKSHANSAVTI